MSSPNPYEYTGTGAVEPVASERYIYKPTAHIAAWSRWWLLGAAIFDAVLVVVYYLVSVYWGNDPDAKAIADGWTDEGLTLHNLLINGAWWTQIFLALVGIVLYCVWAYGSNRNAHALGAIDMRFTPGWTVGWNFIPVLNLAMPYLAIKEIYQASNPLADDIQWKSEDAPTWINVWWALSVLIGVLSYAEMRMAASEDIDVVNAGSYLSFFSTAVNLTVTGLEFHLIRSIQQRLAAKHANKTAPQRALDPAPALHFRDL